MPLTYDEAQNKPAQSRKMQGCLDVRRTWTPGMRSPRLKYSGLEELRADAVPMPYLLFSQTKTTGRSQSFAYECQQSIKCGCYYFGTEIEVTYHVVRLEHLALVRRTIAVQRERSMLFAEVLAGEGKTGANRDLCANNAVSTEEVGCEHVHRAALALRDTSLTTCEN